MQTVVISTQIECAAVSMWTQNASLNASIWTAMSILRDPAPTTAPYRSTSAPPPPSGGMLLLGTLRALGVPGSWPGGWSAAPSSGFSGASCQASSPLRLTVARNMTLLGTVVASEVCKLFATTRRRADGDLSHRKNTLSHLLAFSLRVFAAVDSLRRLATILKLPEMTFAWSPRPDGNATFKLLSKTSFPA